MSEEINLDKVGEFALLWRARAEAAEARVRELEAAWPNEIQAREALGAAEAKVAALTAKLAQMQEVVEAAKKARTKGMYDSDAIRREGIAELDKALAALTKPEEKL